MGYKKKNSIVKNTIEKANRPKYSRNRHSEYCFCNICKGILVDPRTKKSHIARRNTVVRNFLDVGRSSTTVIDLSEIPFLEIEFPDMEIPDNPIQLDTFSSDNESIISSYEEEYNFITNTQPKKGKIWKTEKTKQEEEDLDDNEINFNASDSYEENDNPTEPAETTNASTWIIFWALNYQARCILSDIETGYLIKFLRYLCIFHDENKYAIFATTLKMARKALGICAHMIKLSNHPMANKRQLCTLPIAKNFQKGFEVNCRKWVDRLVDPGMVTDIYDGRIWKPF
ncbi:24399_t:CDS:2, partial [Gigaspora rosea]